MIKGQARTPADAFENTQVRGIAVARRGAEKGMHWLHAAFIKWRAGN